MSSTKTTPPPKDGWEEAELSTLQDGARLTFRERLLWLQDMLEFADRFCGAASGRKLDREGNIVPVRTSNAPVLPLDFAVAEEQSRYQPGPPSVSLPPPVP